MVELSQQQQQRNSTGGGHACAFIQEHVNDLTRNFKAHAVLPMAAILSAVASVQLLSLSLKRNVDGGMLSSSLFSFSKLLV